MTFLLGTNVVSEWVKPRPIGAMDALVASTAQVHGLTLVMRNAKDFEGAVKSVLNPRT
jgi:predicted nucleic acid-binding protein